MCSKLQITNKLWHTNCIFGLGSKEWCCKCMNLCLSFRQHRCSPHSILETKDSQYQSNMLNIRSGGQCLENGLRSSIEHKGAAPCAALRHEFKSILMCEFPWLLPIYNLQPTWNSWRNKSENCHANKPHWATALNDGKDDPASDICGTTPHTDYPYKLHGREGEQNMRLPF